MKNPSQITLSLAALFTSAVIALVTGAAAPAGRYTVASGTVKDIKTKLNWQQMVRSTPSNQTDAAAYCTGLSLNGSGWRLPTLIELETIVDYSVAPPGPTIDTTYFPSTPQAAFWTASPSIGASTAAYVGFQIGNAGYSYTTDTTTFVRCVR